MSPILNLPALSQSGFFPCMANLGSKCVRSFNQMTFSASSASLAQIKKISTIVLLIFAAALAGYLVISSCFCANGTSAGHKLLSTSLTAEFLTVTENLFEKRSEFVKRAAFNLEEAASVKVFLVVKHQTDGVLETSILPQIEQQ